MRNIVNIAYLQYCVAKNLVNIVVLRFGIVKRIVNIVVLRSHMAKTLHHLYHHPTHPSLRCVFLILVVIILASS